MDPHYPGRIKHLRGPELERLKGGLERPPFFLIFLFLLYNGPAPVAAAALANVVRALGLAALLTYRDRGRGKSVVAPPVAPLAPGMSHLWIRHMLLLSKFLWAPFC
jgi:hypothetical protein